MPRNVLVAAFVASTAFLALDPSLAAETVVRTPAPAVRERTTARQETAIFAGGCFWGVQGVFSHVKGVVSATSAYTGGQAANAQYDAVSTGTTGHAESVKVVFDPRQIDYADLLRIYFSVVADPTLVNHQGPDEGPQYRSALFPLNAGQTKVARAYIGQLGAAHVFALPIATRLEGQHGFFPAEGYIQDFFTRNPNYPYIVINDQPKVNALKKMFPAAWRA